MIISFSKLGGGGGYTLPVASQSTLGGVKIGSGLDIDSGGTLSVSGGTGGGMAVYDYDVISSDSTARAELIDLVSGGTQTAVIVKDGIMYYYRGYDEDYGKYLFFDYKSLHYDGGSGIDGINFSQFYAIFVDSEETSWGEYGQQTQGILQNFCYITSEYSKHLVDKNGVLYSSEFLYDVVPGSTPVVGETYTTIYLTITGMVWWGSDFLTVSVNGSEHTIAWWGSKSWFVDGEVYQEDHTTEAGMTADFSHIDEAGNGYISISASAMTVVAVPNNGEGGGTSITTPILASANLQMYRNGEWNSVSAVPNLIYSGASEGILASTMTKVKVGLYNGAYAGNETFYLLYSGVSQSVLSFGYSAVSGVSETLVLKTLDYSAVISHNIQNSAYTLNIGSSSSLWIGTQQEYDLLPSYDDNTLYVIREVTPPTPTGVPADELWYTSDNGQVIQMNDDSLQGVTVVSNTYSDGKGVIKFSGTLTEIPDLAFIEYDYDLGEELPHHLTSVQMSDNVTILGDGAFGYCTGITSMALSSGLTEFVAGTFDNCRALSSITIPVSVTTIGDYTFTECNALSTINYNETMSQWGQISLGQDWALNVNTSVVHCTDGDVNI